MSPWTVLAEGLSMLTSLSIGSLTFLISLAVLLLWIPLKQMPGVGTMLNVIIIAAVIEWSLPFLPHPEQYGFRILQACIGTVLVGFASGIYLITNLGPGPRDGLMTGFQRVTGLPIAWVRASIEIVSCWRWMVTWWYRWNRNATFCFWYRTSSSAWTLSCSKSK